MSETSVYEPNEEHQWLESLVGDWEVECLYHTIPGEEPMQIEGKESAVMLGPFWLMGNFEADMLGTPLIGQSLLGYDPMKQVFISTWKDNYTPFHYRFDGKFNEEKTELLLKGENFDPMRQRISMYRSLTRYISDSERVLKLSVNVEGKDTPILEYRYRRK